MTLLNDLKTLYHLVKPTSGTNHEERLESVYASQAEHYDNFRDRLLIGRRELYQDPLLPAAGIAVDMGGGTGANLEFFGDKLAEFKKIFVVDLSTSLLKVAERRLVQRGWSNVETLHADARSVQIPEAADLVLFSYSLSMIPNWFQVLDRAYELLKPGGRIGVVDFYVSAKHSREDLEAHSWWTRTFWPTWFAADNVFLNPDHLAYLESKFETLALRQVRTKLPYVPRVFGRVPVYTFIGQKKPC